MYADALVAINGQVPARMSATGVKSLPRVLVLPGYVAIGLHMCQVFPRRELLEARPPRSVRRAINNMIITDGMQVSGARV